MDFLRRRLFRSFRDLAATGFLGVMIPTIYWFEMFVVLPSIKFLRTPVLYYGHLFLGSVLMFQIVGNWLAMMMTDTSTRGILMPIPKETEVDATCVDKWRFCAKCEALQPPRAWHCKVCDVCILKRDHHCLFSSCCVGHRNQRHFLLLVAYLCLATSYATFYNNIFIWSIHGNEFRNWWTVLKMIFPLAWFMIDWSVLQFYFMVYMLTLVGGLFTGALLMYHLQNAWVGRLAYDANSKKGSKVDYNLGWKKNLQMIFGRRWLATIFNPFAQSELPHDGMNWSSVAKNKSN